MGVFTDAPVSDPLVFELNLLPSLQAISDGVGALASRKKTSSLLTSHLTPLIRDTARSIFQSSSRRLKMFDY